MREKRRPGQVPMVAKEVAKVRARAVTSAGSWQSRVKGLGFRVKGLGKSRVLVVYFRKECDPYSRGRNNKQPKREATYPPEPTPLICIP